MLTARRLASLSVLYPGADLIRRDTAECYRRCRHLSWFLQWQWQLHLVQRAHSGQGEGAHEPSPLM